MKDFRQTKLDLPPVKDFIASHMSDYGLTRKQAKWQYNRLAEDEIWVNDQYQVNIARGENVPNNMFGVEMIHLSIKRLDKQAIHDWRHFQSIKDSLVGQENEGFELFPSSSRLVDGANQYHLFVFADPALRLPIGWTTRSVDYDGKGTGVTQRPKEETPIDAPIDAPVATEITIDDILAAQAVLDGANVPEDQRIVHLMDPDTGEYVTSDTDPDRVREIIQKFVNEETASGPSEGAPSDQFT